jgi:DNA mismatch repair protein MutS
VGAAALSLLFDRDLSTLPQVELRTLADLNLDQVVTTLFPPTKRAALNAVFRTPLPDASAVRSRLDVFIDLDDPALFAEFTAFCRTMGAVQTRVAALATTDARYEWHARTWFVAAMAAYVDAVRRLAGRLHDRSPNSAAFKGLREFLADYCSTPVFEQFALSTNAVLASLADVEFALRIEGERVSVLDPVGGTDFAAEVKDHLAPFLDEAESAPSPRADTWGLTQFEVRVVRRVIQRRPEPFLALARHCAAYHDFVDPTLARIAEEAEFFLAVRRLMDPLVAGGLPRCYPELVDADAGIDVAGAYDLALALTIEPAAVVGNDLVLDGGQRQVVVTGANQGGKTTFARMLGQLHHLASIGVPVPAARVRLRLADQVLTHFEHGEVLADAEGRLMNDLRRLDVILREATPASIVVLNELFSSTSHSDAREMGQRVLQRLADLGALTIFVTFVDELASADPAIVSLVAEVDGEEGVRRTFRILRQPANGAAYAEVLARRYGLGYEQVLQRMAT